MLMINKDFGHLFSTFKTNEGCEEEKERTSSAFSSSSYLCVLWVLSVLTIRLGQIGSIAN